MIRKCYFPLIIFILAILLTGCGSDDSYVFSGTIEGKEIPIVSQVSGQILSLKEEGEKITPDDELAKIDDEILRWQVKEAEAGKNAAIAKWEEAKAGTRNQQLQQAIAQIDQLEASQAQVKARLKQAEASLSQMDAQLEQLKTQWDGAKDTLAYQEKQFKNLEALYDVGAVSERDLENQKELLNQANTRSNQLEAQYKATLAQYEGVKNEYNASLAQLDIVEAQKKSAKAQLSLLEEGATSYTLQYLLALKEQAEARLEQTKALLNKTSVHSPISGIILRRHVELGEQVKPGTTLFTVMDPKKLEITMYVPEADLNLVQLGRKVDVKADAYPNETFIGEVVRINEKAEFTPKNVQTSKERTKMVFGVKVTLIEGWDKLKPGMPVDIWLTPDEKGESK
ncbi:efflux RND transporter periplasmic adaptor subunit [Microaerobacter geothermalis]|uniref:HlyD family secretion protein n=1 Tax=Microaerobacter geothermalis TaxID=674972 RepID=UPI001F2B7B32|nr:efflux RND transporter periplasmic adaptor subunit [Microaerobacter geothermalis]MCF6095210.1 efflux RND transporter periplasmic adaptor subunit [Microaerobacter geothermalis]